MKKCGNCNYRSRRFRENVEFVFEQRDASHYQGAIVIAKNEVKKRN